MFVYFVSNVLPCIVFVPDLILQHILAVPLLYFSSNSHVCRQFQQNTTSVIVAKEKARVETESVRFWILFSFQKKCITSF